MKMRKPDVNPLTTREREVADWLRAGQSHRDVAARLGISIETVRKHRNSIYRKLSVASIAQLIATLGPHPADFFLLC
jgi:DNA-binding CsgD family transcriptional regulator